MIFLYIYKNQIKQKIITRHMQNPNKKSKNNNNSVDLVFARRPTFILSWTHLIHNPQTH